MTSSHSSHRLHTARVLVVGVGGLGAPAALALARAGVGTLGLIDPDRVELSNLHRQPLYDDADVRRPKVDAAADRLRALCPPITVETRCARFTAADAAWAAGFDVVVDGTDSVAAKFVVNDAAVVVRVPLVHAGATGFRAQLLTVLPGTTACYRCIFEDAPPADEVPSCQEAGVSGPSVVLAGTLQAAETLRLLAGEAPLFAGRLLTIDAWSGTWRYVPLTRRRGCLVCEPTASIDIAPRSEAQ